MIEIIIGNAYHLPCDKYTGHWDYKLKNKVWFLFSRFQQLRKTGLQINDLKKNTEWNITFPVVSFGPIELD